MGPAVASLSCYKQCIQADRTDTNKHLFICKGAVRFRCVNILDSINNSEYPNCFNVETSRLAAKYGQLDDLVWLHDHECSWD